VDSLRALLSELLPRLPEAVREPPELYLAAGAAALLALVLAASLIHLARRRLAVWGAGRGLRREVRELRRRGDFLGAGRRCESLGKNREALRHYRRGGHWEELVELLRRLDRDDEARDAAREGERWILYAELADAAGDPAEAAAAYERAERFYAAAGCHERVGDRASAARCYLAAGMGERAVELLMAGDGGAGEEGAEGGAAASPEVLEAAVRSTLEPGGGRPLTPRMASAVRRGAQLWLAGGDPERAYRLAADAGAWRTAVPIARDYLEPSPETAEACARAGDHLAAAEVYRRLGDPRREAVERAEHAAGEGNAAEAARAYQDAGEWLPAAEQWAAAGEPAKAAELYERLGDLRVAARLYGEAGDAERKRRLEERLRDAEAPEERLDDGLDGTSTQLLVPPPRPGPPPSPPPAIGDRYLLGEELGRGGMGVVYRAEDLLLKRAVAFKVLPKDELADDADADLLLAEARAVARLSHPHIVQIYDAGRDAGGFFIVMELVAGEDFGRLLKHRRLSVRGAVQVGRQICSALAHAHERRIIHRDLKPSNLMWTPERRVKLTDFGLARVFEDSLGKVLTRPAGTPYYMAPEQIRGEAVDPRCDLYSLGCVLYQLLCNQGPYGGASSIYHHLNSRADDPREARPEVPAELAELVLACLEKAPEARPASAREAGAVLTAVAERLKRG